MTKIYSSIHVDKETMFELHDVKDSKILSIDYTNAVIAFLDNESLENLKRALNETTLNENPTETTDKNSKT